MKIHEIAYSIFHKQLLCQIMLRSKAALFIGTLWNQFLAALIQMVIPDKFSSNKIRLEDTEIVSQHSLQQSVLLKRQTIGRVYWELIQSYQEMVLVFCNNQLMVIKLLSKMFHSKLRMPYQSKGVAALSLKCIWLCLINTAK